MFDEDVIKLKKEQFVEAGSVAYLIKDEQKRKLSFANTCCLFAFKNFAEKNKYKYEPITNINLFRVPAISEKYGISDLYLGKMRVDVRACLDGKVFPIPKSHKIYSLEPDYYVVYKGTKNPLKYEGMGYISKNDLVFESQDNDYYYVPVAILNPLEDFREEVNNFQKEEKTFYETEHRLSKENLIAFLDGSLDEVKALDMLGHFLNCEECRKLFVEYSFLEDVLTAVNHYPDLKYSLEKFINESETRLKEEGLLDENAEENVEKNVSVNLLWAENNEIQEPLQEKTEEIQPENGENRSQDEMNQSSDEDKKIDNLFAEDNYFEDLVYKNEILVDEPEPVPSVNYDSTETVAEDNNEELLPDEYSINEIDENEEIIEKENEDVFEVENISEIPLTDVIDLDDENTPKEEIQEENKIESEENVEVISVDEINIENENTSEELSQEIVNLEEPRSVVEPVEEVNIEPENISEEVELETVNFEEETSSDIEIADEIKSEPTVEPVNEVTVDTENTAEDELKEETDTSSTDINVDSSIDINKPKLSDFIIDDKVEEKHENVEIVNINNIVENENENISNHEPEVIENDKLSGFTDRGIEIGVQNNGAEEEEKQEIVNFEDIFSDESNISSEEVENIKNDKEFQNIMGETSPADSNKSFEPEIASFSTWNELFKKNSDNSQETVVNNTPAENVMNTGNVVSAANYTGAENIVNTGNTENTEKIEEIKTLYSKQDTVEANPDGNIEASMSKSAFIEKKPVRVLILASTVAILSITMLTGILLIVTGIKNITKNSEFGSSSVSAIDDELEYSDDSMDKLMTDAFSEELSQSMPQSVEIKKMSWDKNKSANLTTELKEYLNTSASSIWDTLEMKLDSVQGYIASQPSKIRVLIDESGNVSNVKILQSCGSNEIDSVVLQSVKDVLNTMPPSLYSIGGENINLTLVVNF